MNSSRTDSSCSYECDSIVSQDQTAAATCNEPSFDGQPINEYIVQGIWHEQLLYGERLVTVSGKRVRVLDAGQWNAEGGPDFRTVEIELDGKRIRGDVEIHIRSSEWEKHRHDRDFDYNGVILHVFLSRDDDLTTDLLHNGRSAERLELLPFLNPDLETVTKALSVEDFLFAARKSSSRCATALRSIDPLKVDEMFAQAGRDRFEQKVARMAAQANADSLDQVLYQAVMTSMGYKGGKTLFFLLAKRTPIEELKNYTAGVPLNELPSALESVLLHVANLLPATPRAGDGASFLEPPAEDCCKGDAFDSETQQYINRLNAFWTRYSGYFEDRLIPPTRRWYASVRPVNFPTRRIAGISQLLANFDFRRGFVSTFLNRLNDARLRTPKSGRDFKREIAQLALLFSAQGDSYWSHHYTFGGKRTPRSMQLIGDDRASSVLLNAFLPVAMLASRNANDSALQDFIWRLYAHFPALPENTVTKFMTHRLFGPEGKPCVDLRFEKNNQALLHFFHTCCNSSAGVDDPCYFASPLATLHPSQ